MHRASPARPPELFGRGGRVGGRGFGRREQLGAKPRAGKHDGRDDQPGENDQPDDDEPDDQHDATLARDGHAHRIGN